MPPSSPSNNDNLEPKSWKDRLEAAMNPAWADEIDAFEGQVQLRKQGKIEDKIFAETRLRRGVYGQRYDNGKRHDGLAEKTLAFPDVPTKGPDTLWDAPGMTRIKIPFGGCSTEQLEVMADLAEEYSDAILHITTRQDVQLHFVHIEDTPDLMRRLAAVGITTREACGNSVRNVTACPLAGVCNTEAFDVAPYADALMHFLLGHPDVQDFGRKFKPAFSGCEQEACGLVQLHDSGYVARIGENGERGFKVVVGGGLGTVPHQAKVLSEFTPVEELLPQTQAIARVFARLGEKKNRNKARIKFLVAKLGIDEFKRLVEEERAKLPHDPRWTSYLGNLRETNAPAARSAQLMIEDARPDGFDEWRETNVYDQAQAGYCLVTLNLPLGDITSEQTRALVDIAREYAGDNVRTTVEQNIVMRFVPEADLPEVYEKLKAVNLAAPGAGTIVDITSCPGTDTCKLGIAASRGLGGELRERLAAKQATLPAAIKNLKIKMSGCFNSCGQHHVADIGFYGNSRKAEGKRVPHFQVIVGGQWTENAGSYGLAVGSVPSKAIPDLVDALTDRYAREREGNESFKDWAARLGKREVATFIKTFAKIPAYSDNPEFFADWGDTREFTIGDLGIGECAGEIVSLFEIEVVKAESQSFEAQLALDEGDYEAADEGAYQSMLTAARSLVRREFIDVTWDADEIVREFKTRFFDTELFFDKYAKGKFAQHLLDRHANPPEKVDRDKAASIVEESQLFIEAAHRCDERLEATAQAGGGIELKLEGQLNS